MSRGQNPLMLMMALSLPGAAQAIGLGEIHVDSGLNEPLAAEIDIVGASAEDLVGLRASVANREAFLHFGAERPAFLASTTFKIAQDSRGRPVLAVRSTESFTEPLVNMLVDLHWQSGELIRQYTLLLDPAGFPAAVRVATALPMPAAPVVSAAALTLPVPPGPIAAAQPEVVAPDAPSSSGSPSSGSPVAGSLAADSPVAGSASRKMTHVKVGAKATLRGVAWRVGARAESDLQKTMLAIFRANPNAFDGNINRLRLGALLTIPSAAACAAIPKAEAAHEIHAQMAAWRAAASTARENTPARQPRAPTPPAAPVASPPPGRATAADTATALNTATAANARAAAPEPAAATDKVEPATAAVNAATEAALNQRVQTLEQGLHEMQGLLESEHNRLVGMQAQLRYAERTAPVAPVAPRPAETPYALTAAIAAGAALLTGACAMLYRRARRRVRKPDITHDLGVPAALDAPHEEAPPKAAVAKEPVRREPVRAVEPAVSPDVEQVVHAVHAVDSTASDHSPDTVAGLEAAKLREELAAAKLREEIAAAWALPEAFAEATGNFAPITLGSDSTVPLPVIDESSHQDTLDISGETAGLPAATVIMASPPMLDKGVIDTTHLDYNLVDLDLTAQHVHMPSDLHESVVVKERRTNLIDVLKTAIEREPDRRDLRMKLLESYYAAAASNRNGFLEEVQKLARDRDYMGEDDWEKIASMGRHIAPDAELFSVEHTEGGKLADCA